jgi:hypothetical protein
MITAIRRIGVMALGLALISACSGEPTSAPVAPIAAPTAANGDLLGAVTGTVTGLVKGLLTPVLGVQRSKPLAAPITVSQTIGSAGGTISIPAAGVTVTVPVGALTAPTVITMTARAGSLLAYDFAPHGITFRKPLVFTQKLSGTNASLLSVPFLKLGYYSDPSLLGALGGLVSELLGGSVNLTSWTFTSTIPHFSGYMLSCGRDDQ